MGADIISIVQEDAKTTVARYKRGDVLIKHAHRISTYGDSLHACDVFWPDASLINGWSTSFEDAVSVLRQKLVERGHRVFGKERAA